MDPSSSPLDPAWGLPRWEAGLEHLTLPQFPQTSRSSPRSTSAPVAF